MSMHNIICLHIIRKNRPMHRSAPTSVVRAAILVTVPAAIPAVVPATTKRLENTPR